MSVLQLLKWLQDSDDTALCDYSALLLAMGREATLLPPTAPVVEHPAVMPPLHPPHTAPVVECPVVMPPLPLPPTAPVVERPAVMLALPPTQAT